MSRSATTWQQCRGHSTYSLPRITLATAYPGDSLIACLHDSNILTPLLPTCIQFSTHCHSELLQTQVRSHLSQWFSIAWNKCRFLTLANMAHMTGPLLPIILIAYCLLSTSRLQHPSLFCEHSHLFPGLGHCEPAHLSLTALYHSVLPKKELLSPSHLKVTMVYCCLMQ